MAVPVVGFAFFTDNDPSIGEGDDGRFDDPATELEA